MKPPTITDQQHVEQLEGVLRERGVEPSPILSAIFKAQRRHQRAYRSWIGAAPLESLLVAWHANEELSFDGPAGDIARRLLWTEFSRRGKLIQIISAEVQAQVTLLLRMADSPGTYNWECALHRYNTPQLKRLWDAMDYYHPDHAGSITLVEVIHAEMNRRGEGGYVAV